MLEHGSPRKKKNDKVITTNPTAFLNFGKIPVSDLQATYSQVIFITGIACET